jgi:hypothetical protein
LIVLFHFQVWFEGYSRRAVVLDVEAWMQQQGWESDAGLRRRSSIQVHVEQEPVELDVTSYASGHVVWSMVCTRPTPQTKALCEDAMRTVLLAQRYREAILSWGTHDVHPLLAHEQWHMSEPVVLSILDEQTLQTTSVHPHEEDYWAQMGPRMHVLSSALMRAHSTSSNIERLVGVPGIRMEHGWGFDCGWSARWGEESLTQMGVAVKSPILV